jgi:hypothetical protein
VLENCALVDSKSREGVGLRIEAKYVCGFPGMKPLKHATKSAKKVKAGRSPAFMKLGGANSW